MKSRRFRWNGGKNLGRRHQLGNHQSIQFGLVGVPTSPKVLPPEANRVSPSIRRQARVERRTRPWTVPQSFWAGIAFHLFEELAIPCWKTIQGYAVGTGWESQVQFRNTQSKGEGSRCRGRTLLENMASIVLNSPNWQKKEAPRSRCL